MAPSIKHQTAGFSMIELLIIISFIGILAAIAISQYGSYKVKAYNATAKTDLRNGLGAEEAHYSEKAVYLSCSDIESCESVLPGFLGSKNSNGSAACDEYNFLGTADTLIGTASHSQSDRVFGYDSTVGGSITQTGG